MPEQPTCEERIDEQLKDEIETLRTLWTAYQSGEEETEEYGSFTEYGLSFDYVEGHTEFNPGAGYFRYQLSWGGPSDEFRFYCDPAFQCHQIDYAFLDWFDGATRTLTGEDEELLLEIFGWFDDVDCLQTEFERATEA